MVRPVEHADASPEVRAVYDDRVVDHEHHGDGRSLETVKSVSGHQGRRLRLPILFAMALTLASVSSFAQERPKVGVAFGGGSARGIAHVGVIRWFEEHHIPIDVAAGTSMGGLIGGAFATGMDAAEIQAMLRGIDWDEMFGFSNFAFKNIRRKADARAYPSRLEFGAQEGHRPADLAEQRPAGGLAHQPDRRAVLTPMPTFDDAAHAVPAVAVDLRTRDAGRLDRGSLARAMRATMSLPGVFPPVRWTATCWSTAAR